jgi:hypothetical protein
VKQPAALTTLSRPSSFDTHSSPSADSFDANDTTKIADVPPFILLRKAYKHMRDAGSLPPRGTKLTVPSHAAPPHSPFVLCMTRVLRQLKHIEPFMKDLEAKFVCPRTFRV